jgi:uncharacterized protein (DUF169 family)
MNMPEKGEYSSVAETLVSSLSLTQPPVAVSFVHSVPAGIKQYAGRIPAGCRFWQEGGGEAFATSPSDHSLCAVGVYTHNLESTPTQQTDLMDALKVFGELDYVRPEDVAAIPVLPFRPQSVVYSPLAKTFLKPHVVMLFVKANQTLILSEAAQQVENENPPAMGRPACAVIPQVMNSGRAALSLGCCGARTYLDVLSDDMAVFAIPGDKLAAYAQRIEVLSKANETLAEFHRLRRCDVEAGLTPTIKESLAALQIA